MSFSALFHKLVKIKNLEKSTALRNRRKLHVYKIIYIYIYIYISNIYIYIFRIYIYIYSKKLYFSSDEM